jgi:hypothetical protein
MPGLVILEMGQCSGKIESFRVDDWLKVDLLAVALIRYFLHLDLQALHQCQLIWCLLKEKDACWATLHQWKRG